jgi:hypothetical protein
VSAVKQFATHPKTREQAMQLASKAAVAIAKGPFTSTLKARAQRATAELLARQTRGAKISYKTILGGQRHTVVWVDGVPQAAFPPWEGNLEDELRLFDTSLLEDPPKQSSNISQPEWWSPSGKYRVWESGWWLPPGRPRVWTRAWWDKDRPPDAKPPLKG